MTVPDGTVPTCASKIKELEMIKISENAIERLKDSIVSYISTEGSLPWTDGFKYSNLSFDFGGRRVTGDLYAGFNRVMTDMQIRCSHFDSDIFLTAAEIKKRKGCITAGSKGTPIGYPCWAYEDMISGERISQKEYDELKKSDPSRVKDIREIFLGYKLYYVFNMAQTNLEYERKMFASQIDVDADAETASRLQTPDEVIASFPWNVKIVTKPVSEPVYDEATGTLTVNPVSFYTHPGFWYDEVFRQLVHIEGIKTERASALSKDPKAQAKEMIICEIASSLLLTLSDLDNEFFKANGSAYIKSWSEKLEKLEGRKILDFFSMWNKAVEAVKTITADSAMEKTA